MAAIHRPDNGPLYKEPFADSDTEATFRSCFPPLPFPSFTLDPRPQKLDETAECRPRGRPPLLPSPSSSLLPRGSLHFPFIQIFRRLLPRKIPSAEISKRKISGRRKGLVRFIIDRDLSREGRTTSLAVNIPGKSVLCRI